MQRMSEVLEGKRQRMPSRDDVSGGMVELLLLLFSRCERERE